MYLVRLWFIFLCLSTEVHISFMMLTKILASLTFFFSGMFCTSSLAVVSITVLVS